MSLHILQLILSSTGAYWEHYWELDNSYVRRQKISSYDGQGTDKGNGCQFLHEIKIINRMTLLIQAFDMDI